VELLVVITIIGLLAGLSLGALARVRASADQGACVGHLQQIGAATLSYVSDNDGQFPPNPAGTYGYVPLILPYLGGTKTKTKCLTCPADKYTTDPTKPGVYPSPYGGISYAQNGYLGGTSYLALQYMSRVTYPSATALTMDFEEHTIIVQGSTTGSQGAPRISTLKKRHKEFVNVGYCDGHVGRVPMTVFDSCKDKESESNRFWWGNGPELVY
jgi:prepilin-type processing-associated H-X9-DG protein